jgi:hypothetical protein
MSDNPSMGFTKLVPGFDFLQNLAKGATQAMPQMPQLSSWVAPTLSVEELDKRIAEMKAVQFWLDQNARALAATVQALEVQKMTLATLKGMNMNMTEMANALRARTADAMAAGAEKADEPGVAEGKADGDASGPKAGGVIDPLQWWGALTQQFQQIAADALKDAARNTAADTARNMAEGAAREAAKAAAPDVTTVAAKSPAARTSAKAAPAKKARKTAARKRSTSSTK